jgi:putative peptidoglycan lipid II flippase
MTTAGACKNGIASLAAGTLVSRLLGFLRDMLVAALLGPGADAFVLAFRLPNIFRRLLSEGSLGLALGAAVARTRRQTGDAPALGLGARLARRVFCLSLPATLLAALAAGLVVRVAAPGLGPDIADQAVFLLRLCLPYLPLCLYAALVFAVAAAFGDMRLQAWCPALLNLVMAGFGGAAFLLCPGNVQGAAVLLCLGLCCGGLVQSLAGWRWLRAGLIRVHAGNDALPPPAPPGNIFGPPGERELLRGLPLGVLASAPHQLHILAGILSASLAAPGSISALYFAERLVELPLGLTGAVLGLAALPGLAAHAAGRDFTAFTSSLEESLGLSAFFSLPAAAGLAALAGPLSSLLFGRGAYGPEEAAATASALRAYALGLPALCAARPLLTACHALEAGKGAARAALFSLAPVLMVAPAMLLSGPKDPAWAGMAVGLGLASGAWCNVWLLWKNAGQATGERRCRLPARLLGYFAAAALMGPVLYRISPGPWGALALVALCAGLWLALFVRLGSPDARRVWSLLRGSQGTES